MKELIEQTAWTMTPPVPYQAFHICFTAAGLTAVVFLAYYTSKKLKKAKITPLLFGCGVFLGVSEIWKQLFLYYIVNKEAYNWWYFPFQLCSLPMYFCLLLPLVHSETKRKILFTFMQDFNLLGGIMALAEPSGLFHPYWLLTLHGLIWHLLLIFIGLVIAFFHLADLSFRGYVKALPLFCICCAVADFINRTAKPLGQADMFYISPYYPSAQVFFHEIALALGITLGNLIYLLAVCIGGLLIHLIFRRLMPCTPK